MKKEELGKGGEDQRREGKMAADVHVSSSLK